MSVPVVVVVVEVKVWGLGGEEVGRGEEVGG
jgi:hypothetical protein